MGYRSNGRWIITGPADKVTAAWAAARLEVQPFQPVAGIMSDGASFNDFEFYTIRDNGYIRFEFSEWKWYPDYPDVQFYERVWAYFSEVEGLSGKRIHIGEDNAVEESAFGDDYIYLGVHVVFYDEEPTKPATTE